MNARFWVWENNGNIKLTLKPDQTITRYNASWGQDCDGPHEWTNICTCDIKNLKAILAEDFDNTHFEARPDWEKQSANQRDIYAEMMGY